MIDRKCIDGDKAGCATCAGLNGKEKPELFALENYCLDCLSANNSCQVSDSTHQINGTENCKACRWIMPAGKRSDNK
jgi:hypothetical protein